MFYPQEPQPSFELSAHVTEVIRLGQEYAAALQVLDPRLSVVDPKNSAAGFEIGRGVDVVAFHQLGFRNAIVTNDQGAGFAFAYRQNAEMENKILAEILAHHAPPETRFSNLDVFDWLHMDSFSPRLTTMLRMAPSCFSGEHDPAEYIRKLLAIYEKLKQNSAVVLSALSDHPSSEAVFRAAEQTLGKRGIDHQLFIDSAVPREVQALGQRVLVIKK